MKTGGVIATTRGNSMFRFNPRLSGRMAAAALGPFGYREPPP